VRLDEYAANDAVGLAALVRAREVRPRELAALAIEGARRVEPTLNALVELLEDRAETLDEAALPEGPFRGVPTLVKDLYHGEPGLRCENGSRLCAGYVSRAQSEAVARFRAAGFVTIGRATTSELGIAGTTETLACGQTCSPWSEERMAGGSSGGSGAAVGAGVVPVAHGSDGGGSIRIPASACGTVGLKPTRGRVSFGPYAADPLSGWAVRFACTRSVRDTAALLDAVQGPAPGDPYEIRPPERPFLAEVGAPAGRLRVAWCTAPWSHRPGDPQVAEATEATARLLADLGHDVAPGRPPLAWEPFLDAMTDMWSAHTAHGIEAQAALHGREPGPETLEPLTLGFLEHGRAITSGRLLAALDHCNVVTREVARFFADVDVLLTPTLGALPERLGVFATQQDLAPREFFDAWSHLESFLPLFNCTGQPAISLPLATSAEGLPIGMQLVARFGGEATLLRLAAELEQALPWSGRRPPLHVAA
jgi:amidase